MRPLPLLPLPFSSRSRPSRPRHSPPNRSPRPPPPRCSRRVTLACSRPLVSSTRSASSSPATCAATRSWRSSTAAPPCLGSPRDCPQVWHRPPRLPLHFARREVLRCACHLLRLARGRPHLRLAADHAVHLHAGDRQLAVC